jgi:hypothetical protein
MVLEPTVREVEAEDVDAGLDGGAQAGRIVECWPESGDDLRPAHC